MGFLPTSNSKRGFYVITSVVFIVLIILLISIIRNLNIFTNENLNGNYRGIVNFQDKNPYIINITFDGRGTLNGTIQIENSTKEFDNMEYFCQDTHVEFSIYFYNETSSQHFVFMGDMNEEATLISGTVQMSEGSTIKMEGTFYLAILD